MWLVDFKYYFECDWLIELSNNKLSDNNLASELVENRSFFKPIVIEEIIIFMINVLIITLQAKLLSQLRHPNIVSYRESFQDEPGFLYIVMNFCEGGDLYSKLKTQAKEGKALEETQVVEWFVQIAMALQVLFNLIIIKLYDSLSPHMSICILLFLFNIFLVVQVQIICSLF